MQGAREVILASDNEIQAVLHEFTDVSVSNAMRSALLTVITSNYFFTAAQAQLLLSTFDVGFEQTQAAVSLFMRTVNTDALVAALDRMSPAARHGVMQALGERSLFRYMNPTGHYRLDLSKPADRLLAATLKELLMQEGEAENWRNVTLGSHELGALASLPSQWNGVLPSSGVLELDYVAVSRRYLALRGCRACRPRELAALTVALFGFRHETVHNNKANVVTLRRLSGRLYVSCDQLIQLSRGFNVAAARVEVVVIFHARLVDPAEFWRVLYALEGWEQAAVFRRLGAACCFNPNHCSLHYVLDGRLPAELKMAQLLVARAADSPTQAMHNLRIHGRPVKAREDKSLWQLMTTSTATPMLEFDFVGSDWLQLVTQVGENKERLERLKDDLVERETRCSRYAARMELARMRAMTLARMLASREAEVAQEARVENLLLGSKTRSAVTAQDGDEGAAMMRAELLASGKKKFSLAAGNVAKVNETSSLIEQETPS